MDEEVEFKKGSTKVATSINQNQAVGTSLVQQGALALSTPLADPNDVSSFTVDGVVNAKEAGDVDLEDLGANAKRTSNLQ